jgi:hypothetical protein
MVVSFDQDMSFHVLCLIYSIEVVIVLCLSNKLMNQFIKSIDHPLWWSTLL